MLRIWIEIRCFTHRYSWNFNGISRFKKDWEFSYPVTWNFRESQILNDWVQNNFCEIADFGVRGVPGGFQPCHGALTFGFTFASPFSLVPVGRLFSGSSRGAYHQRGSVKVVSFRSSFSTVPTFATECYLFYGVFRGLQYSSNFNLIPHSKTF